MPSLSCYMGMDPASRRVSISKWYGALLLHYIFSSFCVTHAVIQQSSASQYQPVISRDTKHLVEKLYDNEVKFWADEIKNNVLTSESQVIVRTFKKYRNAVHPL